MANITEYSRLVLKRSTVPGTIPTIPTGTTIDSSWLSTDILIGEMFANVADDRLWFRSDNGIMEISLTGETYTNDYTTGATLVGNTVWFDRTDMLSAYSVDLSSITLTGGSTGDYLPLTITGNTDVIITASTLLILGDSTSDIYNFVNHDTDRNTGSYIAAGGAYLFSIDEGSKDGYYIQSSYGDGASMRYDLSSSTITEIGIEKGGAYIRAEVGSPGIVYISDYSSGYTARSLVDKEYVDGVFLSGSPLNYLALTGGTLTGPLIVNSTLNVTGNTVVGELSASTFTIINSGATTRNYVDYSFNTIRTGVTNSTIAAGSGNTINANLRNVFVAGINLTATTNDTSYLSKLNIANVPTGTSINNLGIDASGNVIVGTTGTTTTTFPYDISFAISDETTQIVTGDTVMSILAARTINVTKVRASISTTGATTCEFDVLVGGTTILPQNLQINSGNTSTFVDVTGQTINADTFITVDIIGVGSGATGAKIYILGTTTL